MVHVTIALTRILLVFCARAVLSCQAHQASLPQPQAPPVPIKYMAREPVTHRKALAKKVRMKMRELKKEIRRRGTERGPPETSSVPGHSLWNFNTVDFWIDLHKCRFVLFLLVLTCICLLATSPFSIVSHSSFPWKACLLAACVPEISLKYVSASSKTYREKEVRRSLDLSMEMGKS